MGELAVSRGTWNAAQPAMASESVSFEAFFTAESDRLLRILSVITGSRAEAEDIVQEAFTRVLQRWDRVSTFENPSGYLERTAMNVFRNQYRRATLAVRRSIGVAPEQDVFQAVEDRDVASRALARLTPRQRAALVLTEALGYSGEETGRLLGIKPSTVWALTHQARTALTAAQERNDV
jgi:RNA polymerase sigma-70 factor (ECF subfamily)